MLEELKISYSGVVRIMCDNKVAKGNLNKIFLNFSDCGELFVLYISSLVNNELGILHRVTKASKTRKCI